jgi:glycosyltransferase involved in cell wall biosynthesis
VSPPNFGPKQIAPSFEMQEPPFPPKIDSGNPIFTIITPTLNASATVDEAISSVLAQGVPCEHLVMDGGSSDRTVEIASSFRNCTVHSGRDRGLYDAMNRGAFLARGEWLVFLQADDWLPDGALRAWLDAISRNPSAEIATGSAEAVRVVGEGAFETQWGRTLDAEKTLTAGNIALGEPMLNARAIRKSLFKKAGPFDLAYSLASDRDFLLRLAQLRPESAATVAMTYRYRWHEGSRTMNAGNSLSRRLTSENIAIARKHLADPAWSAGDRRTLRAWHSRQSRQAAMCALEAFDPAGFLGVAVGALSRDPAWAGAFGVEFLKSLAGWTGRGFRTRSQMEKTHG